MKKPLRNLAVGHFLNEPFVEACVPHAARIREVFFAWPGVLSCRPAPEFTDEIRGRMFADLMWCRENGILLEYTEAARDRIAEMGYDPLFGARPVKRTIQREVVNDLSKRILAGEVEREKPIRIDAEGERLVFSN